MSSFIFLPLIFFGCMAYHYKASQNDIPSIIEQPKTKVDIEEVMKEFDGRKG